MGRSKGTQVSRNDTQAVTQDKKTRCALPAQRVSFLSPTYVSTGATDLIGNPPALSPSLAGSHRIGGRTATDSFTKLTNLGSSANLLKSSLFQPSQLHFAHSRFVHSQTSHHTPACLCPSIGNDRANSAGSFLSRQRCVVRGKFGESAKVRRRS